MNMFPQNLKAVLFDMDGTILEPIGDDLPEFKKRWCIAATDFVLPNLPRLPNQASQDFLALEDRVAKASILRAGIKELLADLTRLGIGTAIVTNNSAKSARTVCEKHNISFTHILSRDDTAMKPAPDMLVLALSRLAANQNNALMIGDTRADVGAAKAAGLRCWLLAEPWNKNEHAQRFANIQVLHKKLLHQPLLPKK